MSVIIRLQNLPWSANALDIRQFFGGLSIPEGGVHIVGGELGDAFIAFSTDEDARQAFQRNNGKIKSVQITLTLSSRTEMQRVIEAARTQSYSVFLQANTQTNNVPMPAAIPPLSSSSLMFDKFQQDKKERERKRSRSRERRDRSRDRKDRRRDRSRSRSRDRRKRRERSRSRDRSKSRERRSRDSSRRRSSERTTQPKKIEPWASQQQSQNDLPQLLATNLEELKRNLMNQAALSGNGFDVLNFAKRESWPPSINLSRNQFDQRNDDRRGFQRNDYDPRLSPNCCVKVEPFYGSYGDLRRFFQGCFISSRGIKFINDTSGTRTGIVFVQFGNPQSKVEALSRNNENFGGVSLSIIHIDDKDFENAVDRFIPKSNNDRDDLRQFKDDEIKIFTCLTVEDLPTYVKEQDILKMFSHYPLIGIIIPPKGRGNHVAYVKFSNPDDAKKALSETSIHSIEGKSVTVKPCKDEDFNKINDEHDVKINVRKNNETDCINITGLPFKTTDKDIIDFFSDIGIIPTKIHLISNNFGFTGQAYCEFEKYDDCEKALIKNSSKLGLNLITVEAVTRKEMEKYVNKDEVDDEVEEVPIQQNQIIKQNGLLPQPFLNNQQRFFNQRNNFRGRGGGNNNGNGRGGNNRFGGQNNIRQPNFNTNEDMVPPGCTVFMDNIPYKAGTNEILDFFNGYNVTNNVSRRFNPNNTPSAEAKVVFNNAEDAFIAVRDRHLKTIWDRPIYLRQV